MPSVLVIDDSRFIAKQIAAILKPLEIETQHAPTVAEVFGFRGVPSMLREFPPDLIVLDLMMPQMNGFETLIKLQSMVKAREIPVIMFSASPSENNTLEALNRGAKAFLSKPLDPLLFLKEMARICKEVNQTDLLKHLAPYLDTAIHAEKHRKDLQIGEANLSYLLEVIDDDEEMLRDLVEVFVQDMPGQLEKIKEAVAEKDAHALRQAAHMFKGSISNFGAALLTEQALNLEIKGRENDLTNLAQDFEKLQTDAWQLHKDLLAWLAF